MKRIHLIIKGRVQGVFFRHTTNKEANKLNLKGYVRNLSDGSVEVVAEGEGQELDQLVAFCRNGPEGAEVTDVNIKEEKPKDEFTTFSVRY